ncbi:MAG TPA: serine hydrolase domain-containing protein [Phycisphaerales bacterium]|nr:serine hydrolase domain-containing protein [Phycisphaerales bacterium]
MIVMSHPGMRFGIRGLVCAAILGAGAEGSPGSVSRAAVVVESIAPGLDDLAEEGLAARIDRVIARETLGQFWGAVLVAGGDGVVYSRGFGLANSDLKPIDDRTLFDIGSISKAFTATAVLRLELEGKIRLDAPISMYLEGVPRHAARITIAQLLGHTSGVTGGASMREDSGREVVRSVLESPPAFEPGTRMEYSNAGYFVLAALIEKVSGRTYEEYVRDEVLRVAGMRGSTLIGLRDAAEGAVVAARVDEQMGRRSLATQEPYAYSWGYKGAGGVVASAMDLYAFDRALRGDGLIDALGKERMFRAGQGGYGLGWFVSTTAHGWRHEHSGGVWGFSSEMIRHEDGTVIIVLTNGRNNPVRLAKKLEALVMPELSEDVEAVVHTAGREKDELGIVGVGGAVGAHAASEDGRVSITIMEAAGDASPLVTMKLAKGRAAMLAGELEGVSQGNPATRQRGRVMLGTIRYRADESGRIVLPEDVAIAVMPGYHGTGKDGESVVDARPTIVVQDAANGFWPVILILDHDEARELVKQLRLAAE